MSYQYEIFLSYRRSETIGLWVKNHFAPRLQSRLDDISPMPVRISCDYQIESGAAWPEDLKRRLKTSAILLTVWSASYFRSDWCMAEWRSFRQREQVLGLSTQQNPRGLVYPVRYADGNFFHEDAKHTQCRLDFSGLTYPEEEFRKTPKYLEFDDRVRELADELLPFILAAPVWRQDFPIVEPVPMAPVQVPRTVI
jgi:TIR domain-containing protein